MVSIHKLQVQILTNLCYMSQEIPFVRCMAIAIHIHGNCHPHSRQLPFTFTAIVIHIHGNCHSHSRQLPFTFTAIVIHIHGNCHPHSRQLPSTITAIAMHRTRRLSYIVTTGFLHHHAWYPCGVEQMQVIRKLVHRVIIKNKLVHFSGREETIPCQSGTAGAPYLL